MFASDLPGATPVPTYRNALLAAHAAAILFGLTGILGALIDAQATAITFGRAAFAVLALGMVAQRRQRSVLRALTWRKLVVLAVTGALLASH